MANEIKKALARHLKWIEVNGNRLYLRDRTYLEQDLKTGQCKSLTHVPSSLSTLGIFHGIRGVVRIIDGESDGWQDISAAIGYYAWSIVFQTETYLKQGSLGLRVTGLTNYVPLMACVAATSSQWELPMLNLLERLSADKQHMGIIKRPAKMFEDFVQTLLTRKHRDERLPLLTQESPYGEILERWDDPLKLSNAIAKSLDYHCTRIDQKATEEFAPEFKYTPFDLLPCESMLVHRVRDHQGLSTPIVDHPLMTTLSGVPIDIATNIDAALESPITDMYAKFLC